MAQRKLAIVTSHPIQYYAPVFRSLTLLGTMDVCVFYTWSQTADRPLFDPGFRTQVQWDIPLLTGYAYRFVRNVAKRPGTDHFAGLVNPTLIQEIEAWRADAVLVYGWAARSHLQVLRHFKGRIPVFFRGDSTLLDKRSWWRARARRLFLRWVYSHVDIAISVGSNSRDYFSWCGLRPQRIAFAPHSVDTDRFAADAETHEQTAAAWRLELGIPADAVAFLFAGKLQYVKNPQLLLEAFRDLDSASHLVLVGNGELEDELKLRAASCRNVHFVPFQNQSAMPGVYPLGDIFVLPSRSETWGLALNEAMASNRPIIASSKVGGARDLIDPGVNGWIFKSGDRESLRSILLEATECGREKLKMMGIAARAASVHWSTEECARRISEVVLSYPSPP